MAFQIYIPGKSNRIFGPSKFIKSIQIPNFKIFATSRRLICFCTAQTLKRQQTFVDILLIYPENHFSANCVLFFRSILMIICRHFREIWKLIPLACTSKFPIAQRIRTYGRNLEIWILNFEIKCRKFGVGQAQILKCEARVSRFLSAS